MSICQMHAWNNYLSSLYNPINYGTVWEWFDVLYAVLILDFFVEFL